MDHQWRRQDAPYTMDLFELLEPPKSDVWVCDRCHQMTLSALGGRPDDTFAGLVEACDESVVRQVIDR